MSDGLEIFTDRKVYSIPDGLTELMHDVSKEVLRCQPKNVYKCISDYLITLLKVREAVKVAVPIVERDFEVVETEADFLKKYNLSPSDAAKFATKIQAAYRGYRIRKRLLNIADDVVRVEARASKEMETGEEAIDYTDPIFELLRTRGMTREQTNAAATKIQAYFRGYRLRKIEQQKGIECIIQAIPSHESWRHDWLKEPLMKGRPKQEVDPIKKSFIDFQRGFLRRSKGSRLNMETIFGGNYEEYNLICEEVSCDQVTVPTKLEAIDLARPGDIESSVSEELDIPGKEVMREQMRLKLEDGKLDLPDEEVMFSNWTDSSKGKPDLAIPCDLSDGIMTDAEEGSLMPIEKSKHFLESDLSSLAESEMTHGEAPELTVRSLSHAEGIIESAKGSKTSLGSAKSHISDKSKKSQVSVKSHVSGSPKVSIQETASKKSITSLSKRASGELKTESIKSKTSINAEISKQESKISNSAKDRVSLSKQGSKIEGMVTSSKTSVKSSSKKSFTENTAQEESKTTENENNPDVTVTASKTSVGSKKEGSMKSDGSKPATEA